MAATALLLFGEGMGSGPEMLQQCPNAAELGSLGTVVLPLEMSAPSPAIIKAVLRLHCTCLESFPCGLVLVPLVCVT